MDIQAFYQDLLQWIQATNQKSKELSSEAYWRYVAQSAGKLSQKYNDTQYVKKIMIAHLEYLEDIFEATGG